MTQVVHVHDICSFFLLHGCVCPKISQSHIHKAYVHHSKHCHHASPSGSGSRRRVYLSFLRFLDLGVEGRALSGRASSAACFSSAFGTATSETGSFAGLAASGSAAASFMLAAYPAGVH